MASVMRPVGPLPPSAYWLRRLVAVLVVLAVVLVAWWLFGSLGGSSGSAAPGTSTSGSHSPSPTTSSPSPTATVTVSHTPTVTASTSKSSTASASPAVCPDSVIKVVSSTSESSYPAGATPKLTVEVTNTGTVSCKRDIGQVALELIVTSGNSRVWSSDDCNPGGAHALATLRPGQTFATTVAWDRSTSAPGCPSGKPKAGPGHYDLVARNLTLKSAPAPFSLS